MNTVCDTNLYQLLKGGYKMKLQLAIDLLNKEDAAN